ncbi:MAG: lipoyl(octanoyl) transferase LipB [Synechococcaceae cyanobacterium]|nr:lipoyl(octanoyl) transferase LipB [Synechococcaceae cyanobacterium]
MANRSSAILFEPPAPVPFARAWQWQRQLQGRLLARSAAAAGAGPTAGAAEASEALLLLEHEACYTLGRGADPAFLRFDPERPPHPLFRIDRGGEVTHHVPGQLVAYPVLDLRPRGADLHRYLRELEGAVLDVLAALGLRGERWPGRTGVWLEGRKVAAIGVGARRWISIHGLALNVDCPLDGFGAIVPCGIADRPVGRLADWRPQLAVAAVQPLLRQALADRFDLALRPPNPAERLEGW